MFSFSRKTDYALLILTALAERPEVFTPLKRLAEERRLPYRFVSRIVSPLCEHGLLESREGARGGYRLQRHPSRISVWDVVVAEEGGMALTPCLDHARSSLCPQEAVCTARRGIPTVQEIVAESLASHTLADIMSGRRPALHPERLAARHV